MKKPNILLVMFDTMGYDLIFGKWSKYIKTPNIHRLANKGVNFERCYSAAPVCTPCRTSILTGTYPQVHMMYENGINREDCLPVFTDRLKESGYYNMMIGKTHYGPIPKSFDDVVVMNGQTGGVYEEFLSAKGYDSKESLKQHLPKELHLDSFLTHTAIEKMKNRSDFDQPWFTFCSLFKPHGPMNTPLEYLHSYDDLPMEIVEQINYDLESLDQMPETLRALLGIPQEKEDYKTSVECKKEQIYNHLKLYFGLITFCDDLLGELMDYVAQSGHEKDTLLILTSDHGTQLFHHGFNDKHNFYEESFRVPLIMSQPGVLACGVKEQMAGSLDVTASILAAAGTADDSMYGIDLYTPLVKGYNDKRRAAVGVLLGFSSLVTSRYKLVYYLKDRTGALYDLENDEMENHNLYNKEEYKEIANAMVNALLAYQTSMMNLSYLKKNSFGGGPIGKNACAIIDQMKGIDCQIMLEKMLEEQHVL